MTIAVINHRLVEGILGKYRRPFRSGVTLPSLVFLSMPQLFVLQEIRQSSSLLHGRNMHGRNLHATNQVTNYHTHHSTTVNQPQVETIVHRLEKIYKEFSSIQSSAPQAGTIHSIQAPLEFHHFHHSHHAAARRAAPITITGAEYFLMGGDTSPTVLKEARSPELLRTDYLWGETVVMRKLQTIQTGIANFQAPLSRQEQQPKAGESTAYQQYPVNTRRDLSDHGPFGHGPLGHKPMSRPGSYVEAGVNLPAPAVRTYRSQPAAGTFPPLDYLQQPTASPGGQRRAQQTAAGPTRSLSGNIFNLEDTEPQSALSPVTPRYSQGGLDNSGHPLLRQEDVSIDRLTDRVFRKLERKISVEKERRGR